MPALESNLRRQLETVIIHARDVAEEAARSGSETALWMWPSHLPTSVLQRRRCGSGCGRGRQAGDVRNTDKTQSIDQLHQELAYEYWHRMLFARFLAENHLLMHPDGVAVTLDECADLAPTAHPPAANGFVLAARYASTMLPQIFRIDDVLLEIDFAPEQRLTLEKMLAGLPRETFLADDSLGWVYQFWQSKRKDEVNKSGNKIDSHTISSVTQLFTEDYMVQFLLHNTLGAWWCAKEGISGQGAGVKSEECPVELEYLRWRDDGTPAAGTFEGWPKSLKEFRLLDPCCGSGHFLVAAFNLLVPLRMHDEGLSAGKATDAVLRENLFGLELDPRCTQIAAFALAVAAWKLPDEDGQPLGYRELPSLNIACTGIGPQSTEEEWVKFADRATGRMGRHGRDAIRNGLENLHRLFSQAPTLGSLINPQELRGDVVSADFETLAPLFAEALAEEKDDDAHERAVAAAGMVKAAELLAGEYTLVITNVPYLGRGKQDKVLLTHLEDHYSHSKADLATAFVERCLEFCSTSGTAALVTPQNWLFLTSYTKLREELLNRRVWNLVTRLGTRAFETITGEVVNVALLVLSAVVPLEKSITAGMDVAEAKTAADKAARLANREQASLQVGRQADQLRNPDSVIAFGKLSDIALLNTLAKTSHGQGSFDSPRFELMAWEIPRIASGWVHRQSTTESSKHFAGCYKIFRWENGEGQLAQLMQIKEAEGYTSGKWRAGVSLWGNRGVLVNQMNNLSCSLYLGYSFDENTCVITPHEPSHLPAIWLFCTSENFEEEVRRINQKINVNTSTLAKVPFDLTHWQQIASQTYPNGLPDPENDDPTQWVFHGRPESSTSQLQVAVARVLGYRWPAELDLELRLSKQARKFVVSCDDLLPLADRDGIVPVSSVRGEPPAAERVLELLHAAYGKSWSDSLLHQLLSEAGSPSGTTLDDWLRNGFFDQHCKLFHNRPFVWHIWDGRKDGFSVLVNYHKLDHQRLENLTYSYLGDWIKSQKNSTTVGADLRLAAAQALQEKLKLILTGEPPNDIFVRWKPLAEQAIGWHPDLNDGVRMNIRPFIEAGILRKTPNIKWTKDRGKEPERDQNDYPWFWNGKSFVGDRVNDVHLTNETKTAAQSRKKGAK